MFVLLGLLAAMALASLGVYQALLAVPAEYRAVMDADPPAQREANDEALQEAAALASDLRKHRDWQARFTEAQINGWLAIDLMENHAGVLPEGISDPRVTLGETTVSLYCRLRRGRTETILTLVVEPYLDAPNVLALRFRKARAGLLPLPMGSVVEQIGAAARNLEVKLTWRQADGDPVALIAVPHELGNGTAVRIDQFELQAGALLMAGLGRKE